MLRATPGTRLMRPARSRVSTIWWTLGGDDLEVPLHVGFRGRVAEDTAVGVDEGQVLTLLFGERGAPRGHVPNN